MVEVVAPPRTPPRESKRGLSSGNDTFVVHTGPTTVVSPVRVAVLPGGVTVHALSREVFDEVLSRATNK